MGRGEFTYDDDGRTLYMRGTVMEITARKQLELDLREEQQRLAEAQHIAHVGSWAIELDGRLSWSLEGYRIWGVNPETFTPTQESLLSLVYQDDRPLLATWLEECRAGQQPGPQLLRRYLPDGRLRRLSGQGELQYDAQGQPMRMVGTIQDITERYLADERVRESEQRFRALFEHLPIAYQSLDIQGRWLDGNQKLAELFGFERPEDMLGRDFIDYWDDSIRDHFDCNYDEFKRTHNIEGELLVSRTDGCPLTVQVAGRIQRDASGRFQRTHCILLDVTERRAMEMEILALNADLEKKVEQRTAQLQAATVAKSQFLANMSHEIRTPMNAVLGVAQLLEQEPLTADQAGMVGRIRSVGRSLLHIINDILDFSKIEAGQFNVEHRPFKLPPVLNQLDSLIGGTARGKGLSFRIDGPAPVAGRLIGDALRLEQVLINLTGNAVKFTEAGEVGIRVIPLAVTETKAKLRFEVRDTGIGMTPAALANLFTPFS
jgi:PAS domain S-box-containing protein